MWGEGHFGGAESAAPKRTRPVYVCWLLRLDTFLCCLRILCTLSNKLSPEGRQIVSTLLSQLDKLRIDFSEIVSTETESAETSMISEFDKLSIT